MLSLQSDQAVEIIPTTSDIQRELLNQYQATDEEDAEESSIDLELFNIGTIEYETSRLLECIQASFYISYSIDRMLLSIQTFSGNY